MYDEPYFYLKGNYDQFWKCVILVFYRFRGGILFGEYNYFLNKFYIMAEFDIKILN